MDLGDKTSRYCGLDEDGEVLLERSVATTKKGLTQVFGSLGAVPGGAGSRNAFALGEPVTEELRP
jgi:hypothetical protein